MVIPENVESVSLAGIGFSRTVVKNNARVTSEISVSHAYSSVPTLKIWESLINGRRQMPAGQASSDGFLACY